jgi:hypothetical protein
MHVPYVTGITAHFRQNGEDGFLLIVATPVLSPSRLRRRGRVGTPKHS